MSDDEAPTYLLVGSQALISDGLNYDPKLASLFGGGKPRKRQAIYGYNYEYSIGLEELSDRLQLRGYTARRARESLEDFVAEYNSQIVPGNYLVDDPYLSVDTILNQLSEYFNVPQDLNGPRRIRPGETIDLTRIDVINSLRLMLDLVEDRSKCVTFGVKSSFLRELGIADLKSLLDEAQKEQRKVLLHDAPLVILTEGSSDSRILAAALRITHPHLIGFLRFMDFSDGAEGGAASLVKLVRSFIGAGIANRVVAIADNDTAAHDAFDRLRQEPIPDGYRIIHYPRLPLLDNYPTLGPQSGAPVLMDVNGKAGSLEMYLGRDLLTVDNDLVPVQWTGYVDSQRNYQGSIAKHHKSRIQKKFLRNVYLAQQDSTFRNNQDWTGVDQIIDEILDAFN